MTDPSAPQVFTPETVFRAHPPKPGGGDIWCVGPLDLERIGECAALLLFAFTEEERVYSYVTIITPPDGPSEQEVRGAVVAAFRGRDPETAQDTMERIASTRIRVRATGSLAQDEAVANLPFDQPARQAVIVVEAGRFVGDAPAAPAEERWADEVAALARRVCAAAVQADGYVLLDTGRERPRSPEALAALTNAHDDCGVMTGLIEGDNIDTMVQAAHEIDALVDADRFGEALAAIDALPLGNSARLGLRAGVYLKIKAHPQANEALQAIRAAGPISSVSANLQYARFAREARNAGLAAHFLSTAVDRARMVDDLESALILADQIGDDALAGRAIHRLDALFPGSPILRTYRLEQALEGGDLAAAADLLVAEPQRGAEAEFYRELAGHLVGTPEYEPVLASIDQAWPGFSSRALKACVLHAQRQGRHLDAVELLLARAGDTPSEPDIRRLISAMRGLLLNDRGVAADRVFQALVGTAEQVLARLSATPSDPSSRALLGNLLSTEESGIMGRAALHAVLATRIGERPDASVAEPDRPPTTPEQLRGFQDASEAWMREAGMLMTGRSQCPAHLAPPGFHGGVLWDLVASIESVAESIDEPDGLDGFLRYVSLVAGFAPHVDGPDRDLDILALKLAATQLARANHRQRARDLIEMVLEIAGDDPARIRAAWFAYGEAYRLAGDPQEAAVAIAAGLGRQAAITPTAAWHEALDIIRLLRDLGEPAAARRFIARAREMLEALGLVDTYGSRLETLRLQIEQQEVLRAQPADRDRLDALLADAIANGQAVLALGEDSGPIAAVLAQTIQLARKAGIFVPAEADTVSEALLGALPPAAAQRLRRFLVDPTLDDLAALARELEGARYGRNLVQDVSPLVILARRYLASQDVTSTGAVFASELLADHGLLVRDEFGLERPARLPTAPDTVLATAREISTTGLAVALLGLDETGRLSRVDVVNGAVGEVVREPPEVFSLDRLMAWRTDFPARYARLADERDEAGRRPDGFQLIRAFEAPLQGAGLSNLPPQRVVVIPDAALADIPVNVLPVDGVFAGEQRTMAAAPSLHWLADAAARRAAPRGPSHCWIPTVDAPQDSLLPRVADDLQPILNRAGIGLSVTAEMPQALEGAELAIVAAHGGLATFEGRFFRGVADEAERVIGADRLAHGLAGAKVAILFVCNGARLDMEPGAQATLGLARQLLDRGCSAVIGSPWPLRGDVPSRWLPAFLEAWDQDLPVADANSFANETVGGLADIRHALHVYGDPLVRRRGL